MEYSPEVVRRFDSTRRAGELTTGSAGLVSGEAEDRTLGVWVRFQLQVSDGIVRLVYYSAGKLYYKVGNGAAKVIAKEIVDKDPDKNSSYFNLAYPMFSFANVGSANGLKLMLITQRNIPGGKEYNRQTLTVLMRNYR